jgi:hypothetical protein
MRFVHGFTALLTLFLAENIAHAQVSYFCPNGGGSVQAQLSVSLPSPQIQFPIFQAPVFQPPPVYVQPHISIHLHNHLPAQRPPIVYGSSGGFSGFNGGGGFNGFSGGYSNGFQAVRTKQRSIYVGGAPAISVERRRGVYSNGFSNGSSGFSASVRAGGG